MRARTMAAHGVAQETEQKPIDAHVLGYGGHLWCWMDEPGLFLRLEAGEVPPDFVLTPDETDKEVLAGITGAQKPRASLPVERGDATTIGGVPVEDRFLLMAEKKHGALRWGVFQSWIVGHSVSGVVAAFLMPETHRLVEMAMVEFDGAFWAVDGHNAYRMGVPKEHVDKARAALWKNPAVIDGLRSMFQKALADGHEAAASDPVDGVSTIGGGRYPAEKVLLASGSLPEGTTITWRSTGPMAPVVGFVGTMPVAVISPIVPTMTKGGAA